MKAVCKKLFSLMLVAILLVSAVPFQALAAEVEETTAPTVEETVAATIAETTEATEAAEAETTAPTVEETTEPTVEETAEPTSAPEAGSSKYTITWDANGGKIGTADTQTQTITSGNAVGTLPEAKRSGYTFLGWYTSGGDKVESGTVYNYGKDTTFYAKWELIAKGVVVKAVLNGDKEHAYDLHKSSVGVNELLLDYLDSIYNTVKGYVPAGYTWDTHWYDFTTDELIAQNENFSNWRTVYVKFVAKSNLKLYFNVGEGSVDTTSKTVTFKKAVGELPTPTRSGYVFRGWYTGENGTGDKYTADTVYAVNGDTTLYANWKKAATIVLHIYINGNTSEADRCPVLTNYAVRESITRATVTEIVKKYYSASSGSLSLQGLYTDDTWPDYLTNNNTAGIASVQIQTTDDVTNIYVMVKNAKQGGSSNTTVSTGSSSSGSTGSSGSSSTADPSNPATGDSGMIHVSMTVMFLTAAAFVTVMQLRKRKMI